MKNEKLKSFLFTIAFPVGMYLIMEALTMLLVRKHVLNTMLDIKTLIRNTGISAMIAFALSFNLTSGRFDLSLGAQRLAGTIIGGVLALKLNLSGVWLLLFAIGFGLLFGFLTGLMFVWLRVPPMVLGIGMGLIWEVFPYIASEGKGLNLFGKSGMEVLSSTPFIIGVVIIVGIIVYLIMNKTRFGYELRAIQGSQLVAQNSGINIFKHTVICYTLAGALVCIAGVMDVSYTTQMAASLGLTSNGVVAANMFSMILGNYIGRKSNASIGIIVAALTIKIFSYGLTRLELSEANTNVFNMLLFVGFLVFLANENLLKNRRAEKARIQEAIDYKREAGIA